MDKQEYEMKYLELRLKMLAELWQRLLRQGFVVTFLVLIVCGLSYVIVWLYGHTSSEIRELRAEYKTELAHARDETRELRTEYKTELAAARDETRQCEQERLRQAAVFDEKIQGLRETVERLIVMKRNR